MYRTGLYILRLIYSYVCVLSLFEKNMSTNRDARAAVWTEANEFALLRRLHDYAIEYNCRRVDIKVWEKWAREFQDDFGLPVTVPQLMSKRDRFKRYYECYNTLLTDTGLGWNAQEQKVECSDERWAVFLKVYATVCNYTSSLQRSNLNIV